MRISTLSDHFLDFFNGLKNLILGLMATFILMPSASFGADPQWKAFVAQQDQESTAYYAQQAQARGAWIKANPQLVAEMDKYYTAKYAYEADQRKAAATGQPLPASEVAPTSPPDLATYQAGMAQGAADDQIFLQKLAKERQDFLNSHPGIDTSH